MTAALALAAALALQPPLYGEQVTEVVRVEYGRFAFVEERHDLPAGQPRSLHGPADRWFELRLEYRLGEPGTAIALIDNGAMLSLRLWSERCSTTTTFLAYRGRIGEPLLFASLLESAGLHFRTCGATPAAVRAELAAARAGRADFAAAVQAMKARAETLLGGWRRRCRTLPPRRGRPIIMPMPHGGPCMGGVL